MMKVIRMDRRKGKGKRTERGKRKGTDRKIWKGRRMVGR